MAVLLFWRTGAPRSVFAPDRSVGEPGARHTPARRLAVGPLGVDAAPRCSGEIAALWARGVTSTCEVRIQCISSASSPARAGPPESTA